MDQTLAENNGKSLLQFYITYSLKLWESSYVLFKKSYLVSLYVNITWNEKNTKIHIFTHYEVRQAMSLFSFINNNASPAPQVFSNFL